MRRNRVVAAGLAAVLLLAGLVGVAAVLGGATGSDCPIETPETAGGGPVLVPADQLLPAGDTGDERRPYVAAVAGLGAPFGPLRSGRFFSGAAGVPALVPAGADLGLATTTQVGVVALPGGEQRWSRQVPGAARGGLVGDRFVVLSADQQPALVSFDAADGEPAGCLALAPAGSAPTTLVTDQAGTDVVVALGTAGREVEVLRADPDEGTVAWRDGVPGWTEAATLTTAGPVAVLGRYADPVRLAEVAASGGAATVRASSLEEGAEAWSFPRAGTGEAAGVVGYDDQADVLVALAVRADGPEPPQASVRLVGLEPADGSVRWSARVGRGVWAGSLWEGLAVVQGSPGGTAQLRAYDVATGRRQWDLSAADLPEPDRGARTSFGPAARVGDRYVVPSPNGLLAVDPGTGRFRRLDSPVPVEEVLALGDHLVVRSGAAVLVLDRR